MGRALNQNYPREKRGLKAVFLNRATELKGLLFLGLAVVSFFAFYSYDPLDPSWNMVVDGPIQNWLGSWGAVYADVMIQGFSTHAYLVVLPFLIWGLRYLVKQPPRFFWARFLAFVIVLLTVPALWNALIPSETTGISTVLLAPLMDKLLHVSFLFSYEPYVIGVGLFLSALLYVWSCAFRIRDLLMIERVSKMGVKTLGAAGKPLLMIPRFSFRQGKNIAREERTPHLSSVEETWGESDLFDQGLQDGDEENNLIPIPQQETALPIPLKAGAKRSPQRFLDLKGGEGYQLPDVRLLSESKESGKIKVSDTQLRERAEHLMAVLEEFGVRGEITQVRPGPVVTLYELLPAPGTKASRVIGLSEDIARSMSALSARIAVIPGHNAIGIELPNKERQPVLLREMITARDFDSPSHKLALALGKDISGQPVIADLARMPHLLVG